MTLVTKLHKLLIFQSGKSSRNQIIFWFTFSITFAVIYAILGLQQAFSREYVVQDDARQHVFWMARFLDPNLFPNDLIADYFQSVAPLGYSSLYHLMASVGINPLLFSKLLPLIVGIILTGYCFGVSMQIFPVPITGFIACLMLNQNLWMKDDLASGTARAFVYPLLLAFLYYLLRKSLLPCLVSIVLLGVFYPQYVFISAGILILRLGNWNKRNFGFSAQKNDYIFCAFGLGVAFLVMLPYALKSSEFAPLITLAQAKQLPELFPGGRSVYFNDNPLIYFLGKGRSGMLSPWFFAPVTLCGALVLPPLIRNNPKFPLLKKLTGEIVVLPQILITSVTMFVIAHLLLFRLYLPSRYVGYSFRIVITLSAAIALTTILDAVLSNASTPSTKYNYFRKVFALSFTIMLSIVLLFYYPCFLKKFPKTAYVKGSFPFLYEFFQQQPKDTLIASLTEEVNNLPTFSQRSILAGREYAIPWQFGYYSKFRQRTFDLIKAHYSPNIVDAKNLIQKYGVNFFLLESGTFTPKYIKKNKWLKQYVNSDMNQDNLVQLTTDVFQRLQQGNVPALANIAPNCTVVKIQNFVVIDAKCIIKMRNE
ncbi:MAG: hypothetical protein QNJ47_01040 [Nostocaceae cyanobacterium]|nr:hypothetical protein [Nostocaceae cyanobacterium]